MSAPPRFIITRLRHEGGYWRARVTVDGAGVDVDRRFGSWQADVRNGPRRRSFHRAGVHPAVALELQRRVRRLERREVPA